MGEHDIGLVLFILVVYVWGFCCGWAWHRLSLRDRSGVLRTKAGG